jgi:hypothetical protein
MYPPAWRERYGVEFEALLEDAELQRRDVWDVLRGAFIMRLTKANFVTIAGGCALAGALIAGVMTLARFNGYTSTGTLAVQTVDASRDAANMALHRAMQLVLRRGSMAEIIQRRELQLYPSERANLPLEDVVEKMRSDTLIRFGGFESGRLIASVSFRYPDAQAAQRTTQALMDRLRAELVKQTQTREVRQAAPGEPTLTGKRSTLVAVGALAGLTAGILFGVAWRLVINRGRWNFRRIAGFAVAGTVLGFVIGIGIPDTFLSTAVLLSTQPVDVHAILSDQNLAEIARSQGLAVAEMRADIRIQKASDTAAYMISFRSHDPAKAQEVTRALISKWLENGLIAHAAAVTEVVDPASLPASPISPNRMIVTLLGTAAGLLLGLAASRRSARLAGPESALR